MATTYQVTYNWEVTVTAYAETIGLSSFEWDNQQFQFLYGSTGGLSDPTGMIGLGVEDQSWHDSQQNINAHAMATAMLEASVAAWTSMETSDSQVVSAVSYTIVSIDRVDDNPVTTRIYSAS